MVIRRFRKKSKPLKLATPQRTRIHPQDDDSKMGKGGQQQQTATDTVKKAPAFVVPKQAEGAWESPFSKWTEEDWKNRAFPTMAELKAVVPKHCFERSFLAGFFYIIRDVLLCAAFFYLFRDVLGYSTDLPATAAEYPAWIAAWLFYGLIEGGAWSGLWVIGHECGHHAFSEYKWLDDAVGWVVHSAMLMPFFSWQFSHAKHHRRTNDLVDGETHIPETIDENACTIRHRIYQYVGHTVFGVVDFFLHIVLFYPLYFFGWFGGGQNDAYGQPFEKGVVLLDHYRPTSRLFPPKMAAKVLLSDLGLLIVFAGLYMLAQEYGVLPVALWYGLPCFFVNNFYLVGLTWLQHTHPTIPHLGESDWTWVKGALVGTGTSHHLVFVFHRETVLVSCLTLTRSLLFVCLFGQLTAPIFSWTFSDITLAVRTFATTCSTRFPFTMPRRRLAPFAPIWNPRACTTAIQPTT